MLGKYTNRPGVIVLRSNLVRSHGSTVEIEPLGVTGIATRNLIHHHINTNIRRSDAYKTTKGYDNTHFHHIQLFKRYVSGK